MDRAWVSLFIIIQSPTLFSNLTVRMGFRFTETDYLETFFGNPGDIYGASSTDKAMKNTFAQTRDFVMAQYGLTEQEAWTVVTQGVNFGFTQLVDG